jgi:hypothetical protein
MKYQYGYLPTIKLWQDKTLQCLSNTTMGTTYSTRYVGSELTSIDKVVEAVCICAHKYAHATVL